MAKRPTSKTADPATPGVYTVTQPILHDGEPYAAGDLIELTEDEAAALLRAQCLADVPEEADAPKDPDPAK